MRIISTNCGGTGGKPGPCPVGSVHALFENAIHEGDDLRSKVESHTAKMTSQQVDETLKKLFSYHKNKSKSVTAKKKAIADAVAERKYRYERSDY